jgi:hypothetical protein
LENCQSAFVESDSVADASPFDVSLNGCSKDRLSITTQVSRGIVPKWRNEGHQPPRVREAGAFDDRIMRRAPAPSAA